MKLTFRQKTFLSRLLDIYREVREPVHYSLIARKLGLNNSTAYDMLRLLEKKGLVKAVYSTPKDSGGPGRASVLFAPTQEAMEIFSHLVGDIKEQEDWQNVKARIITSLVEGKADNSYQEMLKELISKFSEPRSSLVLCAEMITALLLKLKDTKRELSTHHSIDHLLDAPTSKLRMSILAGLLLGLAHTDQNTQKFFDKYQEYAEKYEAALQELSKDSLLKLHQFTRNVWSLLKNPVS